MASQTQENLCLGGIGTLRSMSSPPASRRPTTSHPVPDPRTGWVRLRPEEGALHQQLSEAHHLVAQLTARYPELRDVERK
ncbi:hypothetical protein ACFWAY_43680 [Rhodococcus sp. NPDC059968]|uniref:hypothetical protein n=1 Tax=Rhodococcus sp. NPDC059968 TaxID=3347017 RepID=UPI00366BBAC3